MKGEYYNTKESVAEYIEAAKGFDGKKLINKLKQHVSDDSTLLEFGSGPGTDWEILNECYKVTGSDNSSEFVSHLRSKYHDGDFVEMDASALIIDKKFDAIYSNKVLHHLTDSELVNSVKRQFEVLNPNGIVCHSFWLGEGDEEFKGMYVNYHQDSELKSLFEKHFEIVLMEVYGEFESGDSLFLIARKK
ncbi:MAG: class I SAM-dependent methyltransferase [Salibacteraceae bacterium]